MFKIDPSRASDVLVEVLGEEFDGLLGCDYFSAYRKYMRLNENVALQFCMAHLIRDVKFLCDHPDAENRDYGERVLTLLRKLFATIHRRDEYASETTFRQALERVRNDLCWEVGMETPSTREAANLAERFYQHCESYFRFISDPRIDPTNNVAEQAIRFVAIHRRLTQGTRGESGRRWFERICTVAVTCEQQGRSAFAFLSTAVANLFLSTQIKLSALALGIKRIDLGPAKGRVEFANDTSVDPHALIKLVQESPETYELIDGNRLKINRDLETEAARFRFVEKFMEALRGENLPSEKSA